MKTNLIVSKTVALGALVVATLVVSPLAQAGVGPSVVALDERGAAAPVRAPLPPIVDPGLQVPVNPKVQQHVKPTPLPIGKLSDLNGKSAGGKRFVPDPVSPSGPGGNK